MLGPTGEWCAIPRVSKELFNKHVRNVGEYWILLMSIRTVHEYELNTYDIDNIEEDDAPAGHCYSQLAPPIIKETTMIGMVYGKTGTTTKYETVNASTFEEATAILMNSHI